MHYISSFENLYQCKCKDRKGDKLDPTHCKSIFLYGKNYQTADFITLLVFKDMKTHIGIKNELTVCKKVRKYKFIPSIGNSRETPMTAIKYSRRITPCANMSISSEGSHQSYI
jgi:hypothetical protein